MALRLAGEEFSVIRGIDYVGYVRAIEASDGDPGLKVNQKGTGRVFDLQDNGTSVIYAVDGGDVIVDRNLRPTAVLDVRGTIQNLGAGNSGTVTIADDTRLDGRDNSSPVSLALRGGNALGGGEQTEIDFMRLGYTDPVAVISAATGSNNSYGDLRFKTSPLGGAPLTRVIVQKTGEVSFVGNFLDLDEIAAPAAPAADKARLFVQDNGAGKTQLAVRFPTGAVQILATEP